MKTKKHKKKTLSPQEKQQRKELLAKKRAHKRFVAKFETAFNLSDFIEVSTEAFYFTVGNKTIELDRVYIYENIVVVCEETTSASDYIKDHLRRKKETSDEILSNKEQFITCLKNQFAEETKTLEKYELNELIFKFVYFSMYDTNLSFEEKQRFLPWYITEPDVLSYLNQCALGIKKSVKYEMFRFLGVSSSDFAITSSTGNGAQDVKVAIIYPQKTTGRKDGVRLVSFMLSAETLISNSYVLRKDNWEESIGLYQRLIDLKKIRSIRKFLFEKGECFYNNIIVALPDGITFTTSDGKYVDIEDINSFQGCIMHIPNQMNSICIIDGQHRIYAHYQGESNDPMEEKIALLRGQLHLLVTGLIFPHQMAHSERIKIQSEIFSEINSNSKPIPPDVLLHIEMLKHPLSDISLARQIIERLNKKQLFLNYFEFSPLKPARIKVASIIKFALRYLVSLETSDDKATLFSVWENPNKTNIHRDDSIKEAYIEYCVNYLISYFSAIHEVYTSDWKDANSKLISVISFNSFILALRKDLSVHGSQDRDYYKQHYSLYNFDFSKENFVYTSSQYNKFSDVIINKCFRDVE